MFGIIYLVYLPFAISRGLERLGTVWPDGELPINNSITNKGLVADYTFTFYTDTRVPSLGTFII